MTSEGRDAARGFWHSHRQDLAWVGLLAVAIILCFADVVFLPYTFFYQDIQFLHYPGKIYFIRSLLEENYGFWNPYIFGGYPLQAEPEVGPLYPFNLLFALPIPPYFAQTLFVVLHYVLGAAFTYGLARSLKVSRTGAWIAGLVYACSGYLMAQLTNFSILTASIWLPLILWLFSLALQRRSYRHAVAAGVVVALFMLTAHPQFILLTFTVLGLFYLYHLALLGFQAGADRLRWAGKYTLLLAVTVAVGTALAAPQLLPAYELKSLSVLSKSLGYDFVTSYSLSPYRMASFLFPNFLGNQAVGYRGPAFYEEHHNYIGILPLILVALAWARRRDQGALFFGLLLPLSLILSWGSATPIYHLIAGLPLYNLFRVPARWLYPMTMALAILAGFGFDQLLAMRAHPRLARLARGLLILAGVATLTLPWLFVLRPQFMAVTGWFVDHVYPSYTVFTLRSLARGLVQFPAVPSANLIAHALPFLLNPLIFFLAMLDLTAVWLYLFGSGRVPARGFRAGAVLLIVLDLFMVSGSNINPVEPASYFDRRESTKFLQEHVGLYRIDPTNQNGDPNFVLGHYFPMIDRIPSFGGSSSLTVRSFQEYKDTAAENPRLYDLAGIKYVLQEDNSAPKGFSGPLRKVYAEPGVSIWENSRVMPRTFIVHEAVAEPTVEGRLARLCDPAFPLERVIVLDDPDGPALLGGMQPVEAGAASDSAEVRRYSYNAATVECETDRPGFLFLSDNDYPGWQVTVDGRPQKLYQADHMFRAVFVGPGRHTVEFTYTHPTFDWGVAVAGATVAILLAAWIVDARRRLRVVATPAAGPSPTAS